MRRHFLALTLTLTVAVFVAGIKNQVSDGKIVFGVWFDGTTDISGNDTTARVNDRLGFNAGAFHSWQMIPPLPAPQFAPLQNADGTVNFDLYNEGTNAAVFLTVYPQGLYNVTDTDILNLAAQCNKISALGRNVFVRFAPEMNGDWFVYGNNATAFIPLWKNFYTLMSNNAPQVAIVWSPNYNGPDSNEPYDPYWPGAAYVDWVGLSLYWKGFVADWPWQVNKAAPSNYVAQIIDAQGPEGGSVSFYKTYAVAYNKPFVISETGAAFNENIVNTNGSLTPISPGPGHVNLTMSFWDSFLFNQEFLTTYPLFKMVFSFELYKVEDSVQRDFRALTDPTLSPFVAGLQTLDNMGLISWANSAVQSSETTTSTSTASTQSSTSSQKSTANMIQLPIYTLLFMLVVMLK
ncbi:hypothetical protein HK100_010611 [Physocladia obscura]|uniref:GH26 domain-containing protein n=1 Tax=Physocladia obscura TaxID=109957 RepID=A0AAD5T2U7_9FUNG|nr:hypothetical protein HK100_010611 [Physocladia obscura]